MTYSSGSLILASDYNGFVGPSGGSGGTAGANLNDIWSTGSGDKGWGQTAVANPSASSTITATQWAALVNTLSSAGSQTNTTLSSRTAPVAGNLISILPALNTDLSSVTTNRGNAATSGTEYGTFTGTVSKTSNTGSAGSQTQWTITFTHTITFPSADQARYFWNAGGIVRIKYGKSSSNGTNWNDTQWNTFVGQCGTINLTGRVNGASQTIAGQAYTGTTRLGGTGGTQTTLATTTGWYNLTTSPTTIFLLNAASSPYTGEYIQTTAAATSSTVLTLITTWFQPARAVAGADTGIAGGGATTSPSTTITGSAPTTLVTYIPPSTSVLTNTWGTPTINASVA